MRRIALLSDIHANLHALDAVLADIDASGVTERYCLGDLIGYGPDPVGVVRTLQDRQIPIIPGNYDEGVASRRGSCGCYYRTDRDKELGEQSYAYTDSALPGQIAGWILSLPSQIRLAEGEARILLVHGSPRKINEYLLLDRKESQLARLAIEADADVVCHGHIHIPYHRSFPASVADRDGEPTIDGGTIHYVSSGSVGKPKDGDPRAGWVEIVLGSEGDVGLAAPHDEAAAPIARTDVWLGTVVHRVDYDIGAVVSAMREKGLPEGLIEALRRA